MTRSTRIVAKAAVALRPSLRASRYGQNHFPGPGRQHRRRRKPDHRRAKHVAKLRRSERPEQVLPALGPNHKGQRRQHNRQRKEIAPRRRHRRPHLVEIRVPEKNRNEPTARPMTMTVRMMLRKPLSILHDVWLSEPHPMIGVLITSRDAFTSAFA